MRRPRNKDEYQFTTAKELSARITALKQQHTATWLQIEGADGTGSWETLWRRLGEIETELAALEDRCKRVAFIEDAIQQEVKRIRSLGL